MDNANRSFTTCVSCTQNVITTLAGNYSYNFPLNHPTYWTDATATWSQVGGIPLTWARYLLVFDMYKVIGMRVSFLPNFVDTTGTSTDQPSELFFIHDRDDVTKTINDLQALQGGRRPNVLATGKIISHSIKQRRGVPYMNIATIGKLGTDPVSFATVTIPSMYESMKTYFPNASAATAYGRFIIQWIVKFSGLNTINN